MTRTIGTALMDSEAPASEAAAAPARALVSYPFSGVNVNRGFVTYSTSRGQDVLTLSDDFDVPRTPDPHWQVVDTTGRAFLLDRLSAKNAALPDTDRINRSITVPAYISDVASVQIYCAWAEAVLGEATFPAPLALGAR
jgi:hypothetical protein